MPHKIADFVSDRAKNEAHAHQGEYNNTISPEAQRVFGQSLVRNRATSVPTFEKNVGRKLLN